MSGYEDYAQKINDAKLAEIKQIQKDMGYDFDVMGLDQKTVGKRLGINGKYLQSPWKNGRQVAYSSKDEFSKSDFKYAFVKYSSKRSSEFHYTLLVNVNGILTEHDPYPEGIHSLNTWKKEDVAIETIEPKGWYK